MKQVRETKAARSISAYIVLKNGQEVARVHAHFSNSGVCQVDVWDMETVKAGNGPQQAKAGGYGYDKFTACLDGMVIDGVRLYDHCGQPATLADKRSVEQAWSEYRPGLPTTEIENRYGVTFANHKPDTGYKDLYMENGLKRLARLGYTVIQVI